MALPEWQNLFLKTTALKLMERLKKKLLGLPFVQTGNSIRIYINGPSWQANA